MAVKNYNVEDIVSRKWYNKSKFPYVPIIRKISKLWKDDIETTMIAWFGFTLYLGDYNKYKENKGKFYFKYWKKYSRIDTHLFRLCY